MACEMSANDPIRTSATLDFCNGRALGIGVHLDGDFGHAFLRAGLVPIAAWRSADAQPSYDLVAALDRDPARKGNNIGKSEKRRASACRISFWRNAPTACFQHHGLPRETVTRCVVERKPTANHVRLTRWVSDKLMMQ